MIKNIVDKIADRIRLGYLGAFGILLISYVVSFVYNQKVMKQSALVNHSNDIVHSLDNVISYVIQCESAARGYMLTNRKELLSNYYLSRNNTDSALKSVKEITSGNIFYQRNIDSLGLFINDKLSYLDSTILIFDSSRLSAKELFNNRNRGVSKMNKIEFFIHHLQKDEKKLESERNMNLEKYSNVINDFTIIALIAALLLTFYSIFTFNKENKAKREAGIRAADYRRQLELRIEELAALNIELTELKNSEKFAATGRISRTIAHEVRNPLTNINLAAEQLQNEIPVKNDVAFLFEMIARNSNRINQLISDLLNSTRMDDLQYIKSTINDVLDSSLEFASDRIELKQIIIIKDYDKEICPVMVDQEKIKIAFLNIIVNAIEAMDDHGTLHLSTESKNNRCLVKITDTGKGMTKDDLARLFEPYFTTKEKGTGLGLTNTQNIILAHNAKIMAESEPGKGTSFTISFNFA